MKKRIKKLKKKLKKSLALLHSLRDEVGVKPRSSEEKSGKDARREMHALQAAAERAAADAVTEGMRSTLDETIRRLTKFRASLNGAAPLN
jgi:hypothetical protein